MYRNLEELATNERVPEKVREKAGMDAVKGYLEKGMYRNLEELAKNKRVLEVVRKKARSELSRVAEELALRL